MATAPNPNSGTQGNRKTGRLLWIPTTGSGRSLKGHPSGLLSIPYESIRDHSVARGGWMPMVRELRLTVGEEELRFRGGRTFIKQEVAQLLPFVAPRHKT